ncbi:VWA domain-containing protein [Phreatobacter aquaticus]|uniref:VWA domain-containing protein n=1 Tax=Phreatobacter aquaticus TaxID=2570229 RepID=A0A4D7QRX0_9HYPH|nr:pilus assembly protein [Phreatobacter aquaticus]QCK87667.1 VWA domain-containing protein [Phreatobacter aquaticus]
MMMNKLRRFLADKRGSLAVAFAVSMYPVMMMICAAIDLSRMSQQQARLQAALDSAALRVARQVADGKLTGDLNAAVLKAVQGNINPTELVNVQISAVMDGGVIRVSGTGMINPMIANILTDNNLQVSGTSAATWRTRKIDLVLVLDNTGSMASSGKMAALKTAAKNLIASMQAVATRPDAVRIGIVPFDTQVNIGTTYKNQSWLSYSGVSNLSASNWTGCVTDRDQSYDVNDTTPTTSVPGTLFPARQCSTGVLASILPLTTDWAAMNAKVDQMSPSGNTNVTIGLAWGFHMLTPSQPLTEARTLATEPDLERIIILLTDGDNTQNRWTTNGNSIDARTDLACTNVKANGITLYTVRVINGDAALLRRCASQTTMYYDVSTAAQLIPVFQAIAAQIGQLRLTQ